MSNMWSFGSSVVQAQAAASKLEQDSGNIQLQQQVASMGMRTVWNLGKMEILDCLKKVMIQVQITPHPLPVFLSLPFGPSVLGPPQLLP